MTGARILVVDDEPALRRLLRGILERHQFDVVETGDGRAALASVAIDKPSAVLLDLGLPDRDGMELIPLLAKSAAVIVVSAREETQQKIDALDLGADDFVTKPFDGEELLARLRSALRRREAGTGTGNRIVAGHLFIDLEFRRVTRGGEDIQLTPKEYALLAELARHPGRVRTHAELLREIWGPAHTHDLHYLRVAARSLRLKVEEDAAHPRLIINEPGVGYRLLAT